MTVPDRSTVRRPPDLRARRLLITGGTGFLGRCLLDSIDASVACHGKGVEVDVLSRDPAGFRRRHPCQAERPWLRWIAGDLLALDASVLPLGAGYTDVLHAAADTHAYGDAFGWMDQIVGGTRRALAVARVTGAFRFLNVSSGAVYGPQPSDLESIPETYLGAPTTLIESSLYGQAKRLAEQCCTTEASRGGIEVVHARCFATVSEHMPLDGAYAIGNFIRDAMHRPVVTVSGRGEAVRTYLHGRDTAHWLLTLMVRGEPGTAYNVGSDEPIRIADLAERVVRLVSPGKAVVFEGRDEPSNRSRYVPDISRARALGLDVDTPLEDAIRRTVAALRDGTARDTNRP